MYCSTCRSCGVAEEGNVLPLPHCSVRQPHPQSANTVSTSSKSYYIFYLIPIYSIVCHGAVDSLNSRRNNLFTIAIKFCILERKLINELKFTSETAATVVARALKIVSHMFTQHVNMSENDIKNATI